MPCGYADGVPRQLLRRISARICYKFLSLLLFRCIFVLAGERDDGITLARGRHLQQVRVFIEQDVKTVHEQCDKALHENS